MIHVQQRNRYSGEMQRQRKIAAQSRLPPWLNGNTDLSRFLFEDRRSAWFHGRSLSSCAKRNCDKCIFHFSFFSPLFPPTICSFALPSTRPYTKRARVLLSSASQGKRTYVRGSINVSARYSHREIFFRARQTRKETAIVAFQRAGPCKFNHP